MLLPKTDLILQLKSLVIKISAVNLKVKKHLYMLLIKMISKGQSLSFANECPENP